MCLIINGKNCSTYDLNLIECKISAPERKHLWVDIPSGDGQIDLLENIGPPRYQPRTVTLVFESLHRDTLNIAKQIIRLWEGVTIEMQLPKYDGYTISGIAHLGSSGQRPGEPISVSVLCNNPWFVADQERVIQVQGTESGKMITLTNSGIREVIPEVEVETSARIASGSSSVALSQGKHLLPDLIVYGGKSRKITVYEGAVTIRYREAIL